MTCLLILLFAQVLTSESLFQFAVSTELYGPDGPWQALQVGLGTPPQVINLYPGGLYQSRILSEEVCSSFTYTLCGAGGLFNTSESDTYDGRSVAGYHPANLPDPETVSALDTLTLLPATGNREEAIKVPSLSLALLNSYNTSFADNSGVFPNQVGFLSLGSDTVQTLGKEQGVSPAVNASLIPGSLQRNGIINSTSYGLHFGSGILNLPLSLWLGGYDATRVIGPVYTGSLTNDGFQIDLLDVGFGVDAGASPFPFTSKTGLLPITNPLRVQIDPSIPFFQFPQEVCESLTQYLPVVYNSKYLLYLWNTSDPRYIRIVTSPSYLSFTFGAPAVSQGGLTIKIPFRLLNLTLSPPVAPAPVPYFPCMPLSSLPVWILGRAFLQAAFLGVNWSKQPDSEWYLAQAPGPNISPSPSPLAFAETVTAGASNWSETWKDHWNPLADESQPLANNSHPSATPVPSVPSSGNLSTGAKIGIALGVVIFVVLALAAVFHLHHRRDRGQRELDNQPNEQPLKVAPGDTVELAQEDIKEAPTRDPVELSSHPGIGHELPPDSTLYEASSAYR